MSDVIVDLQDETNPLSLLPAANYLMEEAQRRGLVGTAHFIEVAIEMLKEEAANGGKRKH